MEDAKHCQHHWKYQPQEKAVSALTADLMRLSWLLSAEAGHVRPHYVMKMQSCYLAEAEPRGWLQDYSR